MKGSKVILLLEDNTLEVMKFQRAFEKLKILNPLSVCHDGVEGIEWLNYHEEDLPGLIVLDLNMPRMNGIEFLQRLKQNEKYQHIPVVILTTSSNLEDRTACYQLQAAGYMVKPLKFGDYLNIIHTIGDYWQKSQLPY